MYTGITSPECIRGTGDIKYVAETIEPDYHRAVLSFLNYDALKKQLMENEIPKITFKKNDGEVVVLSVHKLYGSDEMIFDTLWVFEKKEK